MTDTIISSATRDVVIGFDRPFVIIGERINPTGRKALAEEMRAGLDLGDRVALDPGEVTGLHLLHEDLPAGRVDPLADDDERLVVPDDDLTRG